MGKLQFRGNLKTYLNSPVFIIGIFFVCAIVNIWFDKDHGPYYVIFVGAFWLVTIIIFFIYSRQIENELIDFATRYGTVQKELLEHFQLPYALIDDSGKLLWVNEQFALLTGKDKNYHKSITSIFSNITRESLAKHNESEFSYYFIYEDRNYRALMRRLDFKEEEKADVGMLVMDIEDSPLIACMIFDETELVAQRELNVAQRMVTGLVYIDNYDETFENVDEVKRSMLTAVIDRKIGNYFSRADGIVRKLEKDKYFVFFPNRYLPGLEDEKFSLLEDIKTTKVGGDVEVTLSIGIGTGGDSYNKSAEYARAAIGLAMGRGGSQAVVKSGGEVSYYGVRGKEVAKSSRVKARVKAQAFREMMMSKNKVIVMGHQVSDMDALGAAVGVYCAARELGKKCQIVLNTVTSGVRPFQERFNHENGYPEDMFIKSGQAREYLTKDTLVVVVDTNRPNYTECPELLDRTKNIVVFDHHRQGKEQIQSPLVSYIEPYASSACEMIAEVLQYFSEGVQLSSMEADCIYAGILIDTNNFMTKTGVRTFEAAAYLRRCGAEVTRVRKLLREDMETYKARAEVVRHAEVYKGAFAISYCPARSLESPTIVGAQAANELLNIVGIKASFVLTEYNNKIYISARSIDEIDVQRIMEHLGGGGHLNVAGAQLEGISFDIAKERIRNVLDEMLKKEEVRL